MMSTYEIRNELRELREHAVQDDSVIMPKALREAIETMTYEVDRARAVCASYRDVLRDILK